MVTVSSEYRRHLPTAAELPDSDETPVDNELQNDIPNILLNLLRSIWAGRTDWFWGVDMGIYYEPNIEDPAKSKCIIPDGFLSLGVPKYTNEHGRLSYVLWEEEVSPILALEVVSHKYNGEYDLKLTKYEDLGILYYVVYNYLSGRRGLFKKHQPLEVYKLIDGKYQLQPSIALLQREAQEGGEMVWMPEIGLGIGCEQGEIDSWRRKWMYWYDRDGIRYLTTEERAKSAEERAKSAEERAKSAEERARQERQEKERLAVYLRSIGINPDEIQ